MLACVGFNEKSALSRSSVDLICAVFGSRLSEAFASFTMGFTLGQLARPARILVFGYPRARVCVCVRPSASWWLLTFRTLLHVSLFLMNVIVQ